MSWYVIAWRDSSRRRINLDVPGLKQWFTDNLDALKAKNQCVNAVANLRPAGGIDPTDGLNMLFKSWNAGFQASGDTLWMDSVEYYHLMDIVPEHRAPTIRFWMKDEWHLHTVDEETGEKELRTVFAITECKDLASAINHAKEQDAAYSKETDEYDTEHWCMDQCSLRHSYEAWRKHMLDQIGVMPPPHVVDGEPEESEDDATQG